MDAVWICLAMLDAKLAELEDKVEKLKAQVEKDKRGAKPAKIDTSALIS